ncbi:MAG: type II secretion system protein [Bryobacteraceae bacterium]
MKRGFTLLEVLVATLIMAIAITGLMSALSTSLRNASKLTDYGRAELLAHQKMDELLIAEKLQKVTPFQGTWGPEITGDLPIGWIARVTAFETPPNPQPGTPILERVELQIWWMNGDRRRTFTLEGFRRSVLREDDVKAGMVPQ